MIDDFPGLQAEKPYMACGYIALQTVEAAAGGKKLKNISFPYSLDYSLHDCWIAEHH